MDALIAGLCLCEKHVKPSIINLRQLAHVLYFSE